MAYLIETRLNGQPQIKSGYTISDDSDVVRELYTTLIKNTVAEIERVYPGKVIQIPLKPGGALLEGVKIICSFRDLLIVRRPNQAGG